MVDSLGEGVTEWKVGDAVFGLVGGVSIGFTFGRSKKEAEQAAAKIALEVIQRCTKKEEKA